MNLKSLVEATPEVELEGTVMRLVQQQGIDSLLPLVDTLEQLARLEALVERSKHPRGTDLPASPSHPLLITPFRTPPLPHGYRFGVRQQRGLFYGSRSRAGTLVEGAYYGLLFWEGLAQPPAAPIRRRQTLFSVLLGTRRGRRLQLIEDPQAQAALRHPSHYAPTQQLGTRMGESGIEAFDYLSARSSEPLVQVGVFTPTALRSTPFDQVDLSVEIQSNQASFLCHDDGSLHRFPHEGFLVDGSFPQAAA
ncbi:MAG: RES family NAD+ phosphorylase [Cyanobium sp.]